MKVAAVIACRVQSTRLYGKPLQLVGDKTILEHLVERLRTVKGIAEIVLAISEGWENAPFVKLAEKMNVKYVWGDQVDVLGRLIKAAEEVKADTIVRATPDCPFIYAEIIDKMIEHHFNTGADLTVCVNLPEGAYVEVIKVEALKKSHELGENRHRSEFCTLFILEHPEEFRIEKMVPPEKVRRPDIRITVDYPEDLIVVRKIYESLSKPDHLISIEEIIEFLDANPKIKEINSWISPGMGRIWE